MDKEYIASKIFMTIIKEGNNTERSSLKILLNKLYKTGIPGLNMAESAIRIYGRNTNLKPFSNMRINIKNPVKDLYEVLTMEGFGYARDDRISKEEFYKGLETLYEELKLRKKINNSITPEVNVGGYKTRKNRKRKGKKSRRH